MTCSKRCKKNKLICYLAVALVSAFSSTGCAEESIHAKRSQLFVVLSPLEEAANFEFELVNPTRASAKIKSVKFDCGCMRADSAPNSIEPGKAETLKVAVKLTGEQGLLKKESIVEFEDGKVLPLVMHIEIPIIIGLTGIKTEAFSGHFSFQLNEKFAKHSAPAIEMPNDYKFDITSKGSLFTVTYKKLGTIAYGEEVAIVKVVLAKGVTKVLKIDLRQADRKN